MATDLLMVASNWTMGRALETVPTCPIDKSTICFDSAYRSCTTKCRCSMTPAASDTPSSSPGPNKSAYSAYSWVICVAIMSTVAFISNFGMNAQKLALVKSAKIDPDDPQAKSKYRKWKLFWLVGMACIVTSAGGDTVALNFGAQSVVAPLSSLTLVANAFIAKAMHGEEMTRRDYMATGLIIIGCVLSVAFAQHKDTLYCAEIIWNQFSEPGVIVYLLLIIAVVFAGMLFSKWAERVRTELGPDSALYIKWGKLHRFSYAGVSGICGAQSVLFMKIIIELFTNTTAQASQTGVIFLGMWQTYPLIIALCACVALQIYWLNLGLARFDALYNVPVFQCFWMLFGVIAGGVFFHEFATFSLFQASMFSLGVLFCLTGVAVLSSRKTADDKTDDEEDDSGSDKEDDLSQSLLNSDTASSTSDYSTDSRSTEQTVSFDATDYPNRFELPEVDAIFYDAPMGLGLYPEIVKITHPQYERVQGMVKVWRIRDFGTWYGSPEATLASIASATNRAGAKERSHSEGSSVNDDGIGAREIAQQKGAAELQGLRPGMMLVGINGESILRQRNTWRETLLRVTNTRKPVVLTFRDIPSGVGFLSPKTNGKVSENVTPNEGKQTPVTPSSNLRGSRDIEHGLSTPDASQSNTFVDMIHAGQITLSENRRRAMDARGKMRYAPKSTDGRLRYEKLHGAYHRSERQKKIRHSTGNRRNDRAYRKRRSATETSFLGKDGMGMDVLAAHSRLNNRPLLGGSLAMLHQPGSMRMDTFDRSTNIGGTGPSPRVSQSLNRYVYCFVMLCYITILGSHQSSPLVLFLLCTFITHISALDPQIHPVAEFADSIGRGMAPVLDRALDLLTGSKSGAYNFASTSNPHHSMPTLDQTRRERSHSSNLGERPNSDSLLYSSSQGSLPSRPVAKSAGSMTPEDADVFAKLVGEPSPPRNSNADEEASSPASNEDVSALDGGELVFDD